MDAWRLLALLAEGEGMTKAAAKLHLDAARASRLIAALEADIGFDLTDHYSRPARLTVEAEELMPQVRKLVSAYAALGKRIACCGSGEMTLRIGIPLNSPRQTIRQLMKDFSALDAALRCEIFTDADHDDVLLGKVDIAYLPYRPVPDGLVIRDISRMINVPFASVDYIRRHGCPMHPDDMKHHDVIVRAGRHYPTTTRLVKGHASAQLRYRNVAYSGDVASGMEALLAGDGVAVDLSFAVCEREYRDGTIVPVLNGWHRPPWDVCLVMRRDQLPNARMVRFFNWFAERESEAAQKRLQSVETVLAGCEKPLIP